MPSPDFFLKEASKEEKALLLNTETDEVRPAINFTPDINKIFEDDKRKITMIQNKLDDYHWEVIKARVKTSNLYKVKLMSTPDPNGHVTEVNLKHAPF